MAFSLFNKYKENQLKDATEFLNLLQRESSFRYISSLIDNFGNKVTYRGRPLSFYNKLWADAALISAPQTKGKVSWVDYHKQVFSAKKSASGLKDFLGKCVIDERTHHFFSLAVSQSKAELPVKQTLIVPEEVEKEPYSPQKTKKIEQLVDKAHKEDSKQILKDPQLSAEFKVETTISNLRTKLAKLTVPSFVKDWGVKLLIFTKKQIDRSPSQIIGAVAGATAGFVAAGPGGAAVGTVAGGIAGKYLEQSLMGNNIPSSREIPGQENTTSPDNESAPTQPPPQSAPPPPADNKNGQKNNLLQTASKLSSFARTGPIVIGVIIGIFLMALFMMLFDDEEGTVSLPSKSEAATLTITPSPYVASCPVINGKISYASYSQGGHCTADYGYDCPCSPVSNGRRANAIDVPTNGQQVILPKINNQIVTWQLKLIYPVNSSEGGGNGNLFQTQAGQDIWTLDILHLNPDSPVALGGQYSSGTPIGHAYPKLNNNGEVVDDHIHFSIGKNINALISLINNPPSEFVCSPNWLPADSLCQ